ncbi:XRE family transcriptional regulator [Actinoplanes sp. URMC 104]|uniref:XRE family transcriptional regulator n=1 Tax=Actinoplanes sp. URMC 104 TaxID=3423409 RepID=UPI003F1C6BF8
MKTRLQAARAARGLKQTQVIAELTRRAEVAGLAIASPSSLQMLLSSFENGRRAVSEPYRMLFRAIYGLTDDELFAPTDANDHDADKAEYAALARRITAARSVDKFTIEMLARQTDYLRTMDRRIGAAALVDQMSGHLATIEESLSHAVLPSVRQRLAAILADSAALAAWQALDVGAVTRAWQYHETARLASLEARDSVLLAHAMAQQAFVLVDVGQREAAAELVGEAVREAGTKVPPRFRAWLLAAQAEVDSANGDDQNCLRRLDEAAAVLPGDPAAVDPELPFIVLNAAHLARWRGNSLARLGDVGAIEELLTALAGDGTISARSGASLHCDLAQAHLVHGDRDEARRYATEGRRLAKEAGSVRQKQRLQKLALLG